MFVNPTLDEVARAADGDRAHARPAARRRGPGVLRPRSRARTGAQGHQGASRVALAAPTCRRSSASTPTSTCSTPRAGACVRRHGPDVGLGPRRAAALDRSPLILSGGLTPENVAEGDRRGAARARSTSPPASRPRRASRTPPSVEAFCRGRRRGPGGHDMSAPAGRAPLRPLRRPVRPRDADAGARRARGGLGRGARRPGLPRRARRAAARLRRAPDAALPRRRLSEAAGHAVYLKREDLLHTGAHKINNALGQGLLAQRMGKTRIIAETGAGQHGVATATACALLGLECVVYMGTEDMRRQQPNVQRMELLGATRRAGRGRRAHAQGGGLGGDPRLGRQRRRHPLRHRLVRRPGAVPGARARPPARDRRRGARAGPRARRPPARPRDRLRRRRLERDRHVRPVRRRRRRRAHRRRGRRATGSTPAATARR